MTDVETGQRKAVIDPSLSGSDFGAASLRRRLQREATTASVSLAVAAESVPPPWLNNVGTDASMDNITSTADILDEFLWNEDMLNLEVTCMKWNGLNDSEIDALAKINPELAENLARGNKEMSSFLSYRRKVAEKQNRKVQWTKKKATTEAEADAAEDDDEEDDEEEDTTSPQVPKGRKSIARKETLVRVASSVAPTVEVTKAVEEKDQEKRKSMFKRRKSLNINKFSSSSSHGRFSRIGGSVVGLDDADRSEKSEKISTTQDRLEPVDRKGGRLSTSGSQVQTAYSSEASTQPLTPKKKRQS
mmetsp:Transcript_98915/g.156514  ORF Transcript_98915/g.156514 Transcript_98915/m.156514 type:complete len:303 (+) Transcript_98915:31-939(+)